MVDTLDSGMDEQQQISKALYDYMLTAHTDHYGPPSVKMRHYLSGLSKELTTRMGLTRTLAAQAEDTPDTLMSVPVEQKWDEERRSRGNRRTADGHPWPMRKWREIQIITSALLPTDKTWR